MYGNHQKLIWSKKGSQFENIKRSYPAYINMGFNACFVFFFILYNLQIPSRGNDEKNITEKTLSRKAEFLQ